MVPEKLPLVTTKNLKKEYFRKDGVSIKALDGINLEVSKGEFLVINGRSGSGKTTLLNIIGALSRPSSGEVLFESKNLKDFTDRDLAALRREKIGFIFQTFNLLPSLTVYENVESALIHSPLTKTSKQEKVASALGFFDLAQKSDMLPLDLSVGQQQKVAIARALVKNPVLILADEPTGEMDPVAGKEIVEKLAELSRESKVTIVVVSHGNFPMKGADRVLFLREGKLVPQNEAGY
jgi:putative ABC transport system ATP-binding protein